MKRHTPLLASILMLLLVSCDPTTTPRTDADEKQNVENNEQETQKSDTPPYREISIPHQEHGYRNFDTTVLRTRKELNQFLTKHTEKNSGWNKLDPFKNALNQAEVDYDEETLVLIRNDATSGNVNVRFDPRIENDQLIVYIKREKQGAIGTAVMQYFAYAVAVDPDQITSIRLEQNEKKTRTLQVNTDNQ